MHEHWKSETLPNLRVDKTGVVVPIGCNQPTFTGGGFDLQEVSLEIVRSAVRLLAGSAYDSCDRPLAILELRDDAGRHILPKWTVYNLEPHPDCCGG